MHPCARCATVQRTCCQRAEILVTDGDIARIRAATSRDDFVELRRPADPAYLEPDPDDPEWHGLTVREGGVRRMLVRRPDGDCGFLGARGCVLDEETRPVVCRLYPYTYDAQRVHDEEPEYCPTSMLLPAGGRMTELLEMSRAKAERWRAQLYAELRADRAARRAAGACGAESAP
ncbi:MAG: YkgJ family cysteine cluster protein [Planctomycetes bacterium]|nr:YkgJ family cysteine cluster protein [Planctomycetota bacterium]